MATCGNCTDVSNIRNRVVSGQSAFGRESVLADIPLKIRLTSAPADIAAARNVNLGSRNLPFVQLASVRRVRPLSGAEHSSLFDGFGVVR